MKVIILQKEKMPIFGLIIGSVLEKNLEDPKKEKKTRSIRGVIGIQAGKMKIALNFDQENITIHPGWSGKINARCRGTLEAFVSLGLGKNPIIPLLKRKMSMGGNLFLLYKLIPILT